MILDTPSLEIPAGRRIEPGRLALLFALSAVLGCPAPESRECQGDFLCPPGTYCVESKEDAVGAVEVECAPESCGDGFVEQAFGEECDDGNDDPDDGCHACQSAVAVDAQECIPVSFDGSKYLFCTVLASWKDAATDCRERGHDLVTVENATENLFLLQHTPDVSEVSGWWLGYLDFLNDGIFVSRDGEPPGFANWVMEEPGESRSSEPVCAELAEDGLWHGDSCQDLQPYICKKS